MLSKFRKIEKIMFLTLGLHLFGVHIFLAYGCGLSEYASTAGECCPMCSLGMIVLRDCSGDSSTTCKPCHGGTFMNQPNGLTRCFDCKSCDDGQGLYISRVCTTISDTVCEVLDGYYCKDRVDGECTFAVMHRHCDPGEEIKTPGTKNSDTVCEACPPGFYSPLGINCTKWTDCLVKGEFQDKVGSSVEDVQCKPTSRDRYGLILAAVFYVPPVFWMAFSYIKENFLVSNETSLKVDGGNQTNIELQSPVQETSPSHSSTPPRSINPPEENKEE